MSIYQYHNSHDLHCTQMPQILTFSMTGEWVGVGGGVSVDVAVKEGAGVHVSYKYSLK